VLITALKAIFGSRNDRLLKQYRKQVESINALEPSIAKFPTPSSPPRPRS
jgi:preprotein translocase subunit SecA